MTELINSMKLIKMYAWEKPFNKDVHGNFTSYHFRYVIHRNRITVLTSLQCSVEIRKQEKRYLFMSAILNSISTAVIPVTPTLASVATIASYRAAGNDISAATVASLISWTLCKIIITLVSEEIELMKYFQAFSVVGTLNFLRVIVSFVPYATRTLGESKVSFARMKVRDNVHLKYLKSNRM